MTESCSACEESRGQTQLQALWLHHVLVASLRAELVSWQTLYHEQADARVVALEAERDSLRADKNYWIQHWKEIVEERDSLRELVEISFPKPPGCERHLAFEFSDWRWKEQILRRAESALQRGSKP